MDFILLIISLGAIMALGIHLMRWSVKKNWACLRGYQGEEVHSLPRRIRGHSGNAPQSPHRGAPSLAGSYVVSVEENGVMKHHIVLPAEERK